MPSRTQGVRTSAVLALFFSLLPAFAQADITINSVTATPDPITAGSGLDVSVNASTDSTDEGGGTDDDWESTYIALNNGGSDIVLFCGDTPNITTDTANSVQNFNDLPIPISLAADTYTVRVRGFADNGDCAGAVGVEDDEDVSETVAVTATTVELDVVLCIDSSTSIANADFELQTDGTITGLNVALSPDSVDGTVRVTTILFGSAVQVGPGPTVIDSQGTLDTYSAALEALPRLGGTQFTNTSGCMSAALDVMCGGTTCPDDGIRRVVDISTDGNPTVNDCGTGGDTNSPNHQACAVVRRDELEAAGISTLNAIGVGAGIGQANMEAWVFPLPAEVFDASAGEAPGPDDDGFVILVEDFNDYEPAILAKIGAELLQGTFIVSKTYDDGTTTPVDITLTCSGDTVITDNTLSAGPGAPAIFDVSGYDETDTCTAVESNVPSGYSSDNTACVDVGIVATGTCTISNTLNSVTFVVNKTFDDNNTADVTISLACTDVDPADITADDNTASELDPANFTITQFPSAGTTCTATESNVPAGYTPESTTCQDDIGVAINGECTVTNIQDPVTFTVNKDFSDNNTAAVDVTLECTGVDPADITADDGQASEASPASFTVNNFPFAGTTCTATESNVPAGYTPVSTTCNDTIALATNGECTVTNNLNSGGFTVNKTYDDGNTAGVTITLTCSDGTVTTNGLTAAPGNPAIFEVTGFDGSPTCTAVESGVPSGYTSNNADCQDEDPLGGSCTIANTQDDVTFEVIKDFDDGNTADVTVSLACTGVDPADITANDNTASEADSANFTIAQFPPAGTTCTATESNVPAGYTPVSTTCNDTIGLANNGQCTVTNNQNPVTFTVTKDFDDNNTANVTISLACTDVDPADITADDNTASEADPANFTVNDFPFGGTTCTATETEPAGYTAVSVTCQDGIAPNTNGECTITNVANTGTFTVRKDWADDSTADVSVTATCTPPAIVLNNPQLAGGSGSAIFNVSRVEENTTCTATEQVPAGYTADISDCQDGDPIDGGCAITNTPEEPEERTTFRVIKDFTDDNPMDVTVEISCFTGLPLVQTQDISETRDVVFVVESFDPGELDCDISELVPEGYSPTYDGSIIDGEADEPTEDEFGCHFDNVVSGEFLCSIVNTPDPVDVVVEKVWVIEGSGGDAVDTRYKLKLYCDAEIVDGTTYCGHQYNNAPTAYDGSETWCKTFKGNASAIFTAQVIPEYPDTDCWVDETVYDDAVEIDNDCGDLVVSAGHGDSCVITNTVFFEGIPTLNQYGVAILALLMLGVGLVGFRRFV